MQKRKWPAVRFEPVTLGRKKNWRILYEIFILHKRKKILIVKVTCDRWQVKSVTGRFFLPVNRWRPATGEFCDSSDLWQVKKFDLSTGGGLRQVSSVTGQTCKRWKNLTCQQVATCDRWVLWQVRPVKGGKIWPVNRWRPVTGDLLTESVTFTCDRYLSSQLWFLHTLIDFLYA